MDWGWTDLNLTVCRVHEHVDQLAVLRAHAVWVHDLVPPAQLKALLEEGRVVLQHASSQLSVGKHVNNDASMVMPLQRAPEKLCICSFAQTVYEVHCRTHGSSQ